MSRPFFTVDEFKTGHNHDTPAKRYLYNRLAQNNGGWDCAMRSYEANAGKVPTKGLTRAVRECLDQQSKRICAEERYNGDQEGPVNYLVHMLAPQWVRKFPEIYALHTGRTIYGQHLEHQLGFENINKSLNTKSTPIKSTKNTKNSAQMLRDAADIVEMLEKYDDTQKRQILSNI